MGTWGYANLENDTAQDVLAGICQDYFDRVTRALQSECGHEYDEYEHAELFVHCEMLLAMSECGMVTSAPEPEELRPLFSAFIKRWAAYHQRGGEQPPAERRQVIEDTFGKLIVVADHACGGSLAHRVGLITEKMSQSRSDAEPPKPTDAA